MKFVKFTTIPDGRKIAVNPDFVESVVWITKGYGWCTELLDKTYTAIRMYTGLEWGIDMPYDEVIAKLEEI